MKALLIVVLLVGVGLAWLPKLRSLEKGPLTDADRARAPGEFVTLSQGRVHYQLTGPEAAPLVVMVHGFSIPSYTWERNVEGLSKAGYRVLTFDLYGRGFSDRPKLAYGRATYVTLLSELLDALAPEQTVHLVGLSMGGAVVAAFSADHPERVLSASFLAPFSRPIDIGPLAWPVVGSYLAKVFYLPGLAHRQLKDLVEPERFPYWVARYQQQMRFEGFDQALIASAQNYLQTDPMEDFRRIGQLGIPSLLLFGDQDRLFPQEQFAPELRKALSPNGQFELIDNAGHALHYERSEQVNAALLRFFQQVSVPEVLQQQG
ncbi:alpha/beta fold hydrolase [Ferrimonas marina]|uniref:Pimeloyl-ACP methyl ester carboxylesterase n=1 Tax=Ferrimonas marina TaxID=299255 RepID=A0A1M5Z5P2_9GAMM|nr:alpha/beta fold hydrolase [Ferrimonas marina]SHI19587.1 Pimeloyl-ACP methyl ester carboxylesterase [Ferrimonas marina]